MLGALLLHAAGRAAVGSTGVGSPVEPGVAGGGADASLVAGDRGGVRVGHRDGDHGCNDVRGSIDESNLRPQVQSAIFSLLVRCFSHHVDVKVLQRRDLRGRPQLGGDGRRGVVPALSPPTHTRDSLMLSSVSVIRIGRSRREELSSNPQPALAAVGVSYGIVQRRARAVGATKAWREGETLEMRT